MIKKPRISELVSPAQTLSPHVSHEDGDEDEQPAAGAWQVELFCGCFDSWSSCLVPSFAPFIGIGEAAMAVMGSAGAIALCIFCVIVVGMDIEIVSGFASGRETESQVVYDGSYWTTLTTTSYRPIFSRNLSLLAFIYLNGVLVVRSYFRNKLRIPGSKYTDCIAACFCSCCAVAQMRTHVKRCEVDPDVDTLLPYHDF